MTTPAFLDPIHRSSSTIDGLAVSLTRYLPPGVDGDVLLLGDDGDVARIIYTAYTEKSLRMRSFRSFDDMRTMS